MFAAVLLFALMVAGPALAHDAPEGWSYDVSCCSTLDCREVPASWITEDADGFTIARTGEKIPRNSSKIKQSKDEHWHWCSRGGKDDGGTICIYVPVRGY